ncbi:ubiquinol oxidase 2, mitochondrial [Arabidopsis lyrata subsp. lyrata]|uniref:ubiquinol oxidase 2, mitochondrial n=1 Tax=Arabidopsis lyrata subsp. lyrata TaxID=81972 RepID=UPI000A29E202|nr:ubiquinol oxidase 2, mitochondrial [Arabidopsis lyrata subsp. lyrata]|eukprot:XP_020883691.1 ubiquinol oxidase 2, mitochondrial [Arabidopsis lyrata subsp. lyrata]
MIVARTTLRALLVCGGGNCNMFVSSVSAASVMKSPYERTKPMRIHDWCGRFGDFKIGSKHVQGDFKLRWRRMSSASATENKDENSTVKKDQNGGGSVAVPSYWGIETAKMKITRKDGSDWPWNCFMPWETYQANLSIDLKKHHVPNRQNRLPDSQAPPYSHRYIFPGMTLV